MSPGRNDLFFVGDGHQHIYTRHRTVMSRCGIDIRGCSRKLYLNYRMTEEIRHQAAALLEGRKIDDLDGGMDDNRRYKSLSHGLRPVILDLGDAAETVQVAVARAGDWWNDLESGARPSICVMTYGKVERDRVVDLLKQGDVPARNVDADTADTTSNDAVRVATMHRAKGLEFDRVIVLIVGKSLPYDDDTTRLIHVALTRARSAAVLLRATLNVGH